MRNAQKTKRFDRRQRIFRLSPFSRNKIERFEGKRRSNNGICLLLTRHFRWRENRPTLELWASGRTGARARARTHGRTSEETIFGNPSRRLNPSKKGQESALTPSALVARIQFLLCYSINSTVLHCIHYFWARYFWAHYFCYHYFRIHYFRIH